ncbi:uncharacterized protein LOC113055468 [Carassius auratus]|uniref:Uncharacterized protein LOC113055468 n=1 Tax=Carassius auratus TaxID=7957 RepID=A0A6P6KZ86_CARAU|nr:uncharacterized protein LOC113055468 [Carassius auratus]
MEKCYFYINGRESNSKVSSSCQLSLTGSQISVWSGGQSSSVRISCFYTVTKKQVQIPSAHSDPVTVTVQISTPTTTEHMTTSRPMTTYLPQAKLRASASVILETDSVELSCENTEDLKMEKCYFNINGRESNLKVSSSCQLSLTGSQISVWSEGQSSSVRISCFYTVMKKQVQKPSAHSDPVTVTVQISMVTSTDKTATKTTVRHTVHTHSEGSWLSVVLVFTVIGLFLSGLIGFIFLCRFTSSADVLTEVYYTSCQIETTSLLTSSDCPSKHG